MGEVTPRRVEKSRTFSKAFRAQNQLSFLATNCSSRSSATHEHRCDLAPAWDTSSHDGATVSFLEPFATSLVRGCRPNGRDRYGDVGCRGRTRPLLEHDADRPHSRTATRRARPRSFGRRVSGCVFRRPRFGSCRRRIAGRHIEGVERAPNVSRRVDASLLASPDHAQHRDIHIASSSRGAARPESASRATKFLHDRECRRRSTFGRRVRSSP